MMEGYKVMMLFKMTGLEIVQTMMDFEKVNFKVVWYKYSSE